MVRAFKAIVIAVAVTALVGMILLGGMLLEAFAAHLGLSPLTAKIITWTTTMFVVLFAYFYTQVEE